MDRASMQTQLGDVPLELTVELDRVRLRLDRARGLRAGDVIRLEKLAGEVALIRVQGAPLATGEITSTGSDRKQRGVRIVGLTAAPGAGEVGR